MAASPMSWSMDITQADEARSQATIPSYKESRSRRSEKATGDEGSPMVAVVLIYALVVGPLILNMKNHSLFLCNTSTALPVAFYTMHQLATKFKQYRNLASLLFYWSVQGMLVVVDNVLGDYRLYCFGKFVWLISVFVTTVLDPDQFKLAERVGLMIDAVLGRKTCPTRSMMSVNNKSTSHHHHRSSRRTLWDRNNQQQRKSPIYTAIDPTASMTTAQFARSPMSPAGSIYADMDMEETAVKWSKSGYKEEIQLSLSSSGHEHRSECCLVTIPKEQLVLNCDGEKMLVLRNEGAKDVMWQLETNYQHLKAMPSDGILPAGEFREVRITMPTGVAFPETDISDILTITYRTLGADTPRRFSANVLNQSKRSPVPKMRHSRLNALHER